MIVSILIFAAALAAFVGVLCFLVFVIGEDSGCAMWIGLAIAVPLGIVGLWALYDELFTEHPAYTLDKREWACTASHIETQTVYSYVGGAHGGVAVPVTSRIKVCDQYGRKP